MAKDDEIFDLDNLDKGINKLSALIGELTKADAELISLSRSALSLSKNLNSISTPGGLNKNQGDNAKILSDLDKLKNKYTNLQNTIARGAEKSRIAEINLQKAREKAFDSFEKNSKKEEAQLEKNLNAYNKTQAQIDRLTKAYNNLAARKERYNNLSANEEMRLNTLQKVTEKYNNSLKSIDYQIGKNQRNVGNYASGWNGLGNAINQLTREAPAFAVSLSTGFLAISNNLPTLSDEISRLISVNKELIAQGQPTKSVFSQLLSSIFSFQTGLSVGVLLLTLYGDKVIKWIADLFAGSKAIDAVRESQKQLNEISVEGQKNAVEETLRVKALLEIAKDSTLSYKERKVAVDELQDQYPAYFENLSKEQIMAGDTAKAENDLTDAILSRAKANAATSKITENQSKIIDLEEKRIALQRDLAEAQRQNNQAVSQANANNGRNEGAALRSLQTNKNLSDVRKEIAETEKEIAALNELNNRLTSYAIERQKESILLDYKKDKVDNKKKKREDVEYLNSYIKATGTTIEQIDEQISKLETLAIINKGNNDLYPITISLLNQLKKVRKELNDMPITDVKIYGIPEAVEGVKKLSEEGKKFADSFFYEFGGNLGFKDTFKILRDEMKGFKDDWKTTFLGVAEIAQETFNFISQLTTRNFDSEKRRLQDQYDVSLKYAGDSKEAQEKLANDLEKQKKDIAVREAKAKKRQALVNIAIDTAQAIVGLWANPGFPAAIPLAVLVGGLGLAQAAIVNAQEIPQYWMGGVHDGGKMMINDGTGINWKETFVTPDGKVHQSDKRNAIIDAPAGTQIFTHDQWLDKQREISLQNMLRANNISMYNERHSQSMTKDDFYEVMSNTLGGQTIQKNVWDGNGFSQFTEKQRNKTRRNFNRANGRR